MPPREAKRSRTIKMWERLAKRDERATTEETRNGTRGSPASIHQQDPDSKDGSLVGDHWGAEAEDLSTTWRMRNTIQMQTCCGARTDSRPESCRTIPKTEQYRPNPLQGRDQDQWTRSTSPDGTGLTSSTEGRSLVGTSILCEENNIGP
jgi:hypothetical protein